MLMVLSMIDIEICPSNALHCNCIPTQLTNNESLDQLQSYPITKCIIQVTTSNKVYFTPKQVDNLTQKQSEGYALQISLAISIDLVWYS